jgi:hypothetical protein
MAISCDFTAKYSKGFAKGKGSIKKLDTFLEKNFVTF